MLFFLIQINVDEAGNIENQPTPTTETYAENDQIGHFGKETMQNTWIFASEIPPPFIFENKRIEEAEQKVVVQTLEAQEIDKPALTDGEILDWIQVKFGDQTATALRIMACESNGNRYAVNWNDAKITGMPSMGLFQLNRPYDEKYFDPIINVSEAFLLYEKRGWQPWSCARILKII